MEQEARAIPIPAHADRSAPSRKALFAIREGSQASIVDATTLKQLFEAARLLAVEWENLDRPFPAATGAGSSLGPAWAEGVRCD
jgi:hypothetical protein